ncbi:hypothetical protein HanIR_Chr01g0047661 [Helianthus annuus]|nr:hypothetical protein HanIR_Chr01g0047661 [Helianthus annuus]
METILCRTLYLGFSSEIGHDLVKGIDLEDFCAILRTLVIIFGNMLPLNQV